MCGRYTATKELKKLQRRLDVRQVDLDFVPRFNIAPTQLAPVIFQAEAGLTLKAMRWGLIPSWAKDASFGARCINARIEGIAEKPVYRTPFKKRRCLVPADGFFEWKTEPDGKQPYYFQLASRDVFCFAGLWDRWNDPDGRPVDSFSIITTAAAAPVSAVHDRMPVILAPDQCAAWLAPQNFADALTAAQPEPLTSTPVSRVVNSSKTDSPACIEPRQPASIPSNMHRAGDVVKVKNCFGGYPLPKGLPAGSSVKIISRDVGYYQVEHDGKKFKVAFPCID